MQNEIKHTRGKLRDTFIIFFVFVSCVPLIVLGVLSLFSIVTTHTKTTANLQQQALRRASEETTIFFSTIIETLSTNFDTLDAPTLSSANSSWQDMYAKKFLEDNRSFVEISFLNLQGKEVAKRSRYMNNQGLLYFSEYPLFKRAIKGEVVISDIQRTEKGNRVTIAVPTVLNGQIIGAVIAEVDLSELARSFQKIRVGETGYMLLFDKKGSLVSLENSNQGNKAKDYSQWSFLSKTRDDGENATAIESRRYVSVVTDTPVIGASLVVPKIGWSVFMEWPLEEADFIITDFRNKIIGALILSIIIVIVIATLLANQFVRPIRKLQEASNEIEKGNFDKKVDIKTNDELEDLGDSFNTMGEGLRRLEELKNEFVYVAAHELRSPVTAIKGYLELIFESGTVTVTPELDRLLSPVRASNNRLVNLVNDLLKVARSEAGKLEITVELANIQQEVQAILDEIRPLALKRNITIHYMIQPDLPKAYINTGSFKEVIMNFVSNAIKYGKDNGTLVLSHEVSDTAVSTSIKDDGRGMSEEDQSHLFQKFFRAGDVKKTTIEGTGLGLFITKELIEKMGGTISVTSKLGVGTTFTVSFKRVLNG